MNSAKKERGLFFLIFFIGVISFVLLRLQVVRLGFEHQEYIKKKNEALEKNKQLELEYANVLSPSKIEQYARENLGLVEQTQKQTRYIK
ncbi:MAG: hypothetical protein WCQ53_07080 [bacterium]